MEKELLNEILSKFDLGDDAYLIIPIRSKEKFVGFDPVDLGSTTKVADKPAKVTDKPATSEIKREDVRQALLNAKRAGIKVKDVMSKYVPDGKDSKFDNVPASSYEALMKEIADYAV